jgi:hypothetical protein
VTDDAPVRRSREAVALRQFGRRRTGLLAVAALSLALPVATPAYAADPAAFGCEGVIALVEVDRDRAADFVPDHYALAEPNSSAGFAEIFVDTVACDRIDIGTRSSHDSHYAIVAVSIESPDSSGGSHFYLLSWVTDAQGFAAWLKDGSGLEERVRWLNALSHDRTDLGPRAWTWSFDAGRPAPHPLTVTAHAADGSPTGTLATFWRDTDVGTVRIQTTQPSVLAEAFGPAAGTVTARGDSELASAFGAEPFRRFAGLSVTYSGGGWRKQVIAP